MTNSGQLASPLMDYMDILFSAFEGWPGIHSPEVKDWIANHQVTAEGWYVANPNLTVADTRKIISSRAPKLAYVIPPHLLKLHFLARTEFDATAMLNGRYMILHILFAASLLILGPLFALAQEPTAPPMFKCKLVSAFLAC